LFERAHPSLQFQVEFAVLLLKTAFILFLVFPARGVARTGLGLHIIPPHVLGAFAVGPDVLAGDAARVAANALIEMKNH